MAHTDEQSHGDGTQVEGVSQMKAVWNRIHAWLDANVPKGYGRLRPGTTGEAIQAAKKAMGLKLPPDV